MGRPPLLNPVVEQFQSNIDDVLTTWRAQSDQRRALGLKVVQAASEAALTACATQWEIFRSEWHKRAIARDTTQFKSELSRRLRALAEESNGGKELVVGLRDLGIPVEVALPKHPPISVINRLKDAKDQNVTFRSATESDRAADRDLVTKYAAKPKSLTREDWLVLELLITCRNVLAHSSTRSVNDMNTALANAAKTKGSADIAQLARTSQRVTASGVGRYLTATIAWRGGQEARVTAICRYVRELGDKFRV